MDDKDELDSEANLAQTVTYKWLIWKTKENFWTHRLQNAAFHQVFSLNKKIKENPRMVEKMRHSKHSTQKTLRMLV
jgi:hypothetical protein